MKLKLKQPRKIIGFKYSYLVSLPLPWLKHHNLDKGDSVDFEIDEEGKLILMPIKKGVQNVNKIA